MLAQWTSQLSRKCPGASLNKCVVSLCLTSCSGWRHLGVVFLLVFCLCRTTELGQEMPPVKPQQLGLHAFRMNFLFSVFLFFTVALQLCVSAHGCAWDRGKGQVCQKSTHYKAFPGEAVHASAEITGEACHRVCIQTQHKVLLCVILRKIRYAK